MHCRNIRNIGPKHHVSLSPAMATAKRHLGASPFRGSPDVSPSLEFFVTPATPEGE